MFKKVLLREDKDLDINEHSQWPELGSSGQGKWKNNNNTINITIDNKLEINNKTLNDSNKTLSDETCSNADQINDFPNLMESMCIDVDKRNRLTNCEPYTACIKVRKCKKIKKTSHRAPLTLDLNMMLNLSLAISEKKQRKKCKRHCLSSQKQLSLNVIKDGNKLDADCPVRYKGKKRPHRKRKVTKIKFSFQHAANTKNAHDSNNFNWEFKVSLNRLRQSILNGLGKAEPIDDLVDNLGRITLNDIQSEESIELNSMDCNRTAQSLLHTKNFKPYCNHLPKKELKEKSKELIKTLRIFQDRMYAKDPIKCKSKRRYVCGCREVRKFLKAESIKLLFFANNLSVEHEMPQILEEILSMSSALNIPIIFSGSAFDLGLWTLKKCKTSVVGILNYEGAEKIYKDIMEELNKAQQDYQHLLEKVSLCLQRKLKGDLTNMESLFQEVEEQIRGNIISKLI